MRPFDSFVRWPWGYSECGHFWPSLILWLGWRKMAGESQYMWVTYTHASCCGVGIARIWDRATRTYPRDLDWSKVFRLPSPLRDSRAGYIMMIAIPLAEEERLKEAWKRRKYWKIVARDARNVHIVLCKETKGGRGYAP